MNFPTKPDGRIGFGDQTTIFEALFFFGGPQEFSRAAASWWLTG
jgi:hypothetical protein